MTTNKASVLPVFQHQSNVMPETLGDRYQIIDVLGRGGSGITYRATDLTNGSIVVIKALSLRRAHDWKAIELFEREARVLAQLNHPAIPRYIDYFQIDNDSDRQFYIVQTLAAGESLASLIENGWQPNSEEVQGVATQILQILIYLHSLIPAVIHRDIKPQNLIRSQDGQISLVDFGSVQDTYHQTITGGSTVVGTYGYMAPEQFRGQAYFSTDLYGLGTTLLFLLTGKDPGTLPQKKLKIDFSTEITAPPQFANWLDRLLEPDIQRRFETATQALAVLAGQQELPMLAGEKPAGSQINLIKSTQNLQVEIPAVGLSRRSDRVFSLVVLVWNSILFLILFHCITIHMEFDSTKISFLLIHAGIGISLLIKCYYRLFSTTTIQVQPDTITYSKMLNKTEYWRRAFDSANNSWVQQFSSNRSVLNIFSSRVEQVITKEERRWLMSEIAAFIARTPK